MWSTYAYIARNIERRSKVSLNKAYRIARTEGHRISCTVAYNAQVKAKEIGADIVKQWDSTLDGRTRSDHAALDGQIREIEEPFEVGLRKAMYPGDFGVAAEDCNCRCAILQRATWGLDEEELATLKDRASYFGLDDVKDFGDYKKKYLMAEREMQFGIRYGNDAITVNMDYINSKEYRKKFDGLTDKNETNESVYNVVKSILEKCSGSKHEDMYLLDMKGNILSKVTNTEAESGIKYTKEFENTLDYVKENNIPVIAIHNHPEGCPPSPEDFKKAYENKYSIGIAAGHNGQIYTYSNKNVQLSANDCDNIYNDIISMYNGGVDIDRSSKMFYNVLKLNYNIL